MAGQITISTENMSFAYLDMLKKNNPAWRLLASPQAPFIASFLYRVFIQVNQRQISEQELSSLLDDYISMLNEGTDENLFPRNGREYLSEWANDQHGWLRRFFPPGKDEPYYDITSLAQKAIDWLLSLKQQSFIGTESRLITVFELLHQILAGSEADPQRRLEELRALATAQGTWFASTWAIATPPSVGSHPYFMNNSKFRLAETRRLLPAFSLRVRSD